MNTLIRPEYYLIPGRHPADCRCSEHALKQLLGSAVTFPARAPTLRPSNPKSD